MFNKVQLAAKNLSFGSKKILGNIGWLSAERILNMSISLFVGVYVIRYLGAENFGKLSYSISFVALFTAISKLGLDRIVVRNLVKQKDRISEILGTTFILKFLGSCLAALLSILAIFLSTSDTEIRQITMLVAISLVFSSFDTLDLWFQSQVLSKSLVIVRSIQLIITSVIKLYFVVFKYPLIAFAYLFLADSIIRAIGMMMAYFQTRKVIIKWRTTRNMAFDLLKDSYPLILSSVMVTLYMKIDQVMLGTISSSQEVGNYAAAIRFSEIWYFIPIAICSSVFPSIIKMKEIGREKYYLRLQQLYDLMAIISLIIAVLVTVFSNSFIDILLGQEYYGSGQILSIHIWAGLFVFLGVARSQWLIAENYTKFSFVTTLLGAISNIALNCYLIPLYGGLGAAWATLISYAISSHLSCFFYAPMHRTGYMLFIALFAPFRLKQIFLSVKSSISSS